MSTLTLTRAGKLNASKTMNNTACKCAAMRTKIYPWKVRIEGTDRRMSKEGFLLNNEKVGAYFDNRWGVNARPWTAVSCELMALTSAKELCAMVHEEADVVFVEVSIKGSNGAWITARCGPHDLGLSTSRPVMEHKQVDMYN